MNVVLVQAQVVTLKAASKLMQMIAALDPKAHVLLAETTEQFARNNDSSTDNDCKNAYKFLQSFEKSCMTFLLDTTTTLSFEARAALIDIVLDEYQCAKRSQNIYPPGMMDDKDKKVAPWEWLPSASGASHLAFEDMLQAAAQKYMVNIEKLSQSLTRPPKKKTAP